MLTSAVPFQFILCMYILILLNLEQYFSNTHYILGGSSLQLLLLLYE